MMSVALNRLFAASLPDQMRFPAQVDLRVPERLAPASFGCCPLLIWAKYCFATEHATRVDISEVFPIDLGPLSSSPEIALDREGSFALPNDDKEAPQLCVARQVPAFFRSRQLSDRLVSQKNPNVCHGAVPSN